MFGAFLKRCRFVAFVSVVSVFPSNSPIVSSAYVLRCRTSYGIGDPLKDQAQFQGCGWVWSWVDETPPAPVETIYTFIHPAVFGGCFASTSEIVSLCYIGSPPSPMHSYEAVSIEEYSSHLGCHTFSLCDVFESFFTLHWGLSNHVFLLEALSSPGIAPRAHPIRARWPRHPGGGVGGEGMGEGEVRLVGWAKCGGVVVVVVVVVVVWADGGGALVGHVKLARWVRWARSSGLLGGSLVWLFGLAPRSRRDRSSGFVFGRGGRGSLARLARLAGLVRRARRVGSSVSSASSVLSVSSGPSWLSGSLVGLARRAPQSAPGSFVGLVGLVGCIGFEYDSNRDRIGFEQVLKMLFNRPPRV